MAVNWIAGQIERGRVWIIGKSCRGADEGLRERTGREEGSGMLGNDDGADTEEAEVLSLDSQETLIGELD